LSFGQFEGFFVDTCILLPQALDAVMKACSEFLKEYSSRCILSSSVKKEGLELIERSYNTIVTYFQSAIKPYLIAKGVKELSNRDGKLIADFFVEQKAQFSHLPYKRTNIQYELISTIETYVASQLHSLKNGEKMPIDVFLGAVTAELAIAKREMGAPFRGLRCEEIKPRDSVTSAIVIGAIMKNPDDAYHLASALEFQFSRNKWVIFVTTDQEDILSKAPELEEMFLRCSRPEWAMDYHSDLTKNKAPIEHAKEKHDCTLRQQRVIDAIGISATPK
jgi:hypothetical protein